MKVPNYELLRKVIQRLVDEELTWLANKGPEHGDPEERAFHQGRLSAFAELLRKVIQRLVDEELTWLANKGPEHGDPEERAFHQGRLSAFAELFAWVNQ
jgi:hypothetical protein